MLITYKVIKTIKSIFIRSCFIKKSMTEKYWKNSNIYLNSIMNININYNVVKRKKYNLTFII